jgi:predicted NAD/FAD-binding protein
MLAPAEAASNMPDPLIWTRRELLRSFMAATGLPALDVSTPRRRVGIIGGGMAGVSLAWLLDGECDVVLLEARESIGGNVRGVDVELDGQSFVVDIGAQYFHPGPYPLYTALLGALGLYTPGSPDSGESHIFPASITLTAAAEPSVRFVSPVLPQRWWPLFAQWNQPGTIAFARAFSEAKRREAADESWALTLGDWLPTLGLSRDQWEGMLLPWAASLFTGDIEQARGFSARAAMIFAAKALPANPLQPTLYYVLEHGLGQVLQRLIDQTSTVSVITSAPVLQVSRESRGRFRIGCLDGRMFFVDDLVLASGPGSLRLLEGMRGTGLQQAALRGIEFQPARLALHVDPIYAAPDARLWSFLNCRIEGSFCEASMWLASVLSVPQPLTAAKIWKSWTTHRAQQPALVLHEAFFNHMVPTPATLVAQAALRGLQGHGGVWFAGGFTFPYDAQETALASALQVAIGMNVSSVRTRALA